MGPLLGSSAVLELRIIIMVALGRRILCSVGAVGWWACALDDMVATRH